MNQTATRGTRQRFYNQLARAVRSSETLALSLAPLDQHTNESISAYGGAPSSIAAPTRTRHAHAHAHVHAHEQQGASSRHPAQAQDTQTPGPSHPHEPHLRSSTRTPALTADDSSQAHSQDIYLSRRTRRTRHARQTRYLFRSSSARSSPSPSPSPPPLPLPFRERAHNRTPPPRKTVQSWLQTLTTAESPERQPSIPSSSGNPVPQAQPQGQQQRRGDAQAQENRPQQQQQRQVLENQEQKYTEQMQYPSNMSGYRPSEQFQQPIYLSSPGPGVAVGTGSRRGGYDRSMEVAALQEENKIYESLQRRLDDRSSQADSIETLRAANERLLLVLQHKNYALSHGQSSHPTLSPGPAHSLAPLSLSAPLPIPAPTVSAQPTELHLELSRLQRELDTAKRMLEDRAERLAAAEKERDGAKKGQSATAKVNHEMEVRVREAEERCRHEVERCEALEKRLREAESQSKINPSIAKELEVKRAQLANAHRERESSAAKYRSLENDYSKLADKLKVSRVEKEALQARVGELVAQQAEVQKLQADKDVLKDALFKERSDSDRLRKERAALREQLETRSKTKPSHRQATATAREPTRERERDRPRPERERTCDDVPPDGIGYGTGKGEVIDDFQDVAEPVRRGRGRAAYVDTETTHRTQKPEPEAQVPGLGKYSPLKPARQGPLGLPAPLDPSRPTVDSGEGHSSMGMGLGLGLNLNLDMGMAPPPEPDRRRAGVGNGAGPSGNPNYHGPGTSHVHTHAHTTAATSTFDSLVGGTAPQPVDPFVGMVDVLG